MKFNTEEKSGCKINGNKASKDKPESLCVKIWGKREVERDPGER